jgi:UDP-N-acetylglucosamine 4,6-dehydratase|tara:strand:+ start:3338 stop:4345 length:1008 start_codon:yes stop_codon:yes gene_type:complete
MFKGKKVLITGGTGSLGQALAKKLLELDVDSVGIFSRNESKQVEMKSEFNDDRLNFYIGDIRDLSRLREVVEDVNIVFHSAALKHVSVIEYNPYEAIKTNVIGSQNVVDAALYGGVDIAVAVGTDKAVSPLNTYGATKLLMEKLFVTAHNYVRKEKHKTKFISLRYGNVLGSSGSVVPKFINQMKKKQKVTITDPNMTRFSITMDKALEFILESTKKGIGGEIFSPKLLKYSIMDLTNALLELYDNTGWEKIPIGEGEKMHEILINEDEMRSTMETDSNYIIASKSLGAELKKAHPDLREPKLKGTYSSEFAEEISKDELKQIIKSQSWFNDSKF